MTRPTSTGVALAAVGVLAALAAWRFSWPELWVLAAMAAVALVAALVATAVVPPIRIERVRWPERVTAGEQLPMSIRISNPSRRRQGTQPAIDAVGDLSVETVLPPVPGRGEAVADYSLVTRRRGHHRLGPILVDRGDPLGLLRAVGRLGGTASVIVHPATHVLRIDPAGRRRDLDGDRTDLAEGSITFRSLREYVPGDDLRRVHWRSSAKTGTLVVRQDVDPSEPRLVLVVDLDAGAWEDEDLEAGLEVAASMVRAAARDGHALTYVDGQGRVVTPGADGQAVMDELAAAVTEPGVEVAPRLQGRGLDGAGLAVVVTGDPARADAAVSAGRLVAHTTVVVVVRSGAVSGARVDGSDGVVITAPDAPAAAEAWMQWAR